MKNSERFFSFEDSKSKIENWCAYRDRSINETRQKLSAYGLTENEIERVLSHLLEFGFLDDKRFADSFVSGKFRIKNWGKQKIYSHLLQKGIDKSLIQDALQQIDYDDYLGVIQVLLEKKWIALTKEKDPWKRKQKVIQFLAGRGFEFGAIQEAFTNAQI